MKIWFVNRYFFPDHSATSQLLSDLAFKLAGGGFDVEIITSRQRYDNPNATLPVQETIRGVKVRRIWTSRFGRSNLFGRLSDYLCFYMSAAAGLFLLVRKGHIVVAKTDPPLISVIAAVCCKARGAVLVNWCQDIFPEVAGLLGIKLLGGWLGNMLRIIRNGSWRFASVNVVLGTQMAKRLAAEGVSEDQIEVIHNWFDGSIFPSEPEKVNQLRSEWGLSEKFVVGYSGNFGRAHEFNTILSSAEALKARNDIVFIFIGGGARRDYIEEQIVSRGLQNVRLMPYQPKDRLGDSLRVPDLHIISLMPKLEGLIVPSKFYGIAAAGRPSIFIGDVDGEIARILRDRNCGYAVEVGNYKKAAALIEDLAGNPDKCRELGRRARAAFQESYDMPVALERWRATLKNLRGNMTPPST